MVRFKEILSFETLSGIHIWDFFFPAWSPNSSLSLHSFKKVISIISPKLKHSPHEDEIFCHHPACDNVRPPCSICCCCECKSCVPRDEEKKTRKLGRKTDALDSILAAAAALTHDGECDWLTDVVYLFVLTKQTSARARLCLIKVKAQEWKITWR